MKSINSRTLMVFLFLLSFKAVAWTDLEPRLKAPQPLNERSTEVSNIPIERDEFPNKDLFLFGYYGSGGALPDLNAVKANHPELLTQTSLDTLSAQDQRKLRYELAKKHFNAAKNIGNHATFLDIAASSPIRANAIESFVEAIGDRYFDFSRNVNGKDVSYKGNILLSVNGVWDWHRRPTLQEAGERYAARLRRYGNEGEPVQAGPLSDGSVDHREFYQKILHDNWYRLGMDSHLDHILIVDPIDEPYLHVRKSGNDDRIYKELIEVNEFIKNSFAQYSHCFKVNPSRPEICRYAYKMYPYIDYANPGQGKRVLIRTNYSYYILTGKRKIAPNSDIVSYDCYSALENDAPTHCDGRRITRDIEILRDKMTCDQELFLIPESWAWQKNPSRDVPSQKKIIERVAYNWDLALLDTGVEKRECIGKVNKIIGFAHFIWRSFDWNSSGSLSYGASSPYFETPVESAVGESVNLHEVLKEMSDMMLGHKDRRQLIPRYSDSLKPTVAADVPEVFAPVKKSSVSSGVSAGYVSGIPNIDKTEDKREEELRVKSKPKPIYKRKPRKSNTSTGVASVEDSADSDRETYYSEPPVPVPPMPEMAPLTKSQIKRNCSTDEVRAHMKRKLDWAVKNKSIYMERYNDCQFKVNDKFELLVNDRVFDL